MVKFDAGTTPNDFLYLLTPTQTAVPYVALDPGFGGGMLDFGGGTNADAVPITEGSGYTLIRDASQAPSILTIPAQTIAN